MKLLKKAAMFGLDARIALAIFGVLSVISGAALYSAIQDAKVTAMVTELSELEKAIEQYYLDTAQRLPNNTTGYLNAFNFQNMLTNDANYQGWNGPYLSNDYNDVTQKFTYSNGEKGLFAEFEYGDWGDGTPAADVSCTAGELCAIFIQIFAPGVDFANAIDLKVDGELDVVKGKIRLHDGSNPSVYYKTNLSFIK